MLRDMTDKGGLREVTRLPHAYEFYKLYHRVPEEQRLEMENHINGLLIECCTVPQLAAGLNPQTNSLSPGPLLETPAV